MHCRELVLVAVALLLFVSAPASAAQLSYEGGVVTYAAGDEVNDLTLEIRSTFQGWGFRALDQVEITGAGCEDVDSNAGTVECVGLAGPPSFAVTLGAGDDSAYVLGMPNTNASAAVDLGPGQDVLTTGMIRISAQGGDGNDAFVPDAYRSAGVSDPVLSSGDSFSGGPGVDAVHYGNRNRTLTTVSLAGVANDGEAGESDNLQADVEQVAGGSGPDVITGNDASNAIDGNIGNDVLNGGGGDDELDGGYGDDKLDGGAGNDTLMGHADNDTLTGGPGVDKLTGDFSGGGNQVIVGNDTLDARDGVGAEQVSCGPGADRAVVDAGDNVSDTTNDPQNACETIEREAIPGGGGPGPGPGGGTPPAGQGSFIGLGSLRQRGAAITGRVTCLRSDAVGCNGTMTLRSATKLRVAGKRRIVTIGSATFSLDPGATRTVRVRLTKTARRLRGRIKVRVTATSTRPAGQRYVKTVTLIFKS